MVVYLKLGSIPDPSGQVPADLYLTAYSTVQTPDATVAETDGADAEIIPPG
jgi:hypothetical protein